MQSLGLVPALDLETLDDLKRVVDATCDIDEVIEYKLGMHAVLHIGLFNAVKAIREFTEKPVIYDHQKAGADMPDSAGGFVRICEQTGISGLILYPVAGPTAVREFVTHSLNAGLDPVVGGHIPVPDYAISGGGYLADDTVDRIMSLAAGLGATHFVLPANEPENIQRRSEWLLTHVIEPVLYVTGIGPLGGSITESFQAAQGIATRRAIIGRRICAADDPHGATQTLADEMNRFA